MDNPLLDLSGLPRFDEVEPGHVGPALDRLLAEAQAALESARAVLAVDWESFVWPLEDATEGLARAWAQVSHLQAVADEPALRQAYNDNLARVTAFGSPLEQDPGLYAGYQALATGPGARPRGHLQPRRSHHPVPRDGPRPAPAAHRGGRTVGGGHQRSGVGRGRAAQPVHAEFLLGMGARPGHDRAPGHQRAAAAPMVRQDAGGQELPEWHADGAPARIRAVRHAVAPPWRGHMPGRAGPAGAGARRGRGQPGAGLAPFPHQFTHVFGGGYAAGYYSYTWAEVLSADAYSAFEQAPSELTATGARFRREVLARGGSRPAMHSFVALRGREPGIEALLRQHGMAGQGPQANGPSK